MDRYELLNECYQALRWKLDTRFEHKRLYGTRDPYVRDHVKSIIQEIRKIKKELRL